MITILRDAEVKLLETANGLRADPTSYYAIHFHFSQLREQFRSAYQLKIAINIISNLFKAHEGGVFSCKDADIMVIYRGENKPLLEKAIFQLRYLFMDDPLAYNARGFENEKFYSYYDLAFQWHDFAHACKEKLRTVVKEEDEQTLRSSLTLKPTDTVHPLRPYHLARLETELENIDITRLMRQQPICAAVPGKDITPVFNETYLSITHLRSMLMPNVDFTSNKNLYRYLTELLDKKVLHLIKSKQLTYLQGGISLNLNVSTLLSDDFLEFDATIRPRSRVSIVIEINVADVFANMADFITAKTAIQALGYRICLDGLDNLSFTQLDREALGCDLAKLRLNEIIRFHNNAPAQERMIEAVKSWGINRIILSDCDTASALEYGKRLGISLFQGRYLDKILDPLLT